MAAPSRAIWPFRHRDRGPASCCCRRSSASTRRCARSPTIMPRKATSCWRRTCSGAWSPASSSATPRRISSKAFGFYQRFDADQSIKDIADALKALRARPECNGKVGALGFCLGGKLAYLAAARTDVDCAVCYYGVGIEADLGEADEHQVPDGAAFRRARQVRAAPRRASRSRPRFARPSRRRDLRLSRHRPCLRRAGAASLRQAGGADGAFAHDRAVPQACIGPHYDLSALWDQHYRARIRYPQRAERR